MPNRDLKESNRRSPSLQLLSDAAERLWYRLITAVDDFGRMEADPEVVLSSCFIRRPQGWSAQKVTSCLTELSTKAPERDRPMVCIYQHGLRMYLQIRSAETHIYKRAKTSKYPDPTESQLNQDVTEKRTHMRAHAGGCTPIPSNSESRIPNPEIPNPETPGRGFDQFWKCYPKKKSKGDARTAWNKLKPDEPLQDRMFHALERAKTSGDWTKDGGQYIPHPARWLHAQGWEDENVPVVDVWES